MGQKSNIEWTDATWNPVSGCSKVSQGCKFCYAERVANRFWKKRKFTNVVMHLDRLDQPLRWKKPRRIFVNSMSDLFHERVSDKFIASVFAVMAATDQHTFQILTKRPERMLAFIKDLPSMGVIESPLPLPNVWLGISCEDQQTEIGRASCRERVCELV